MMLIAQIIHEAIEGEIEKENLINRVKELSKKFSL